MRLAWDSDSWVPLVLLISSDLGIASFIPAIRFLSQSQCPTNLVRFRRIPAFGLWIS